MIIAVFATLFGSMKHTESSMAGAVGGVALGILVLTAIVIAWEILLGQSPNVRKYVSMFVLFVFIAAFAGVSV